MSEHLNGEMVMSLAGDVILITGAGKGIGRALAKAFGHEGARLALMTRSAGDFETLKQEIVAKNLFMATGDVADEITVKEFVTDVRRKFSRIDCLINNAGVLTPKSPLTDVKAADWDETMRVNLRGPFLFTKYVAPIMIGQKSGSIINVSSGAGKREAPEWGPYAVSKFGVEGLTQIAAAELKPFGVRVNSVNPGGTRTRMRAAAYPNEDPATLPTPDEVARLFIWLASDEGKDVTGQSIDYSEWKTKANR